MPLATEVYIRPGTLFISMKLYENTYEYIKNFYFVIIKKWYLYKRK